MAPRREVVGTLTHAELVDLVLRQAVALEQAQATITELQAVVAHLQARVRDLERQLAQRDRTDPTQHMPGLKPKRPGSPPAPQPRQPRPLGFSRPLSPQPTAVVTHAAPVCPHCRTPLSGGHARWRKEVLDLPPLPPARIIHHVYVERTCPHCGRTVPPPLATLADLGVLAGRQRLGTALLAHIALLRTELRLPLALIQWYLGAVHGLELSQGAICGALQRVARAGQPLVAQIRQQVRASPVVHADETGLRQGGTNGYLWSFSTPTERLYVHGTREKSVVDQVLGPTFTGTLVTDFYAAYDHYDGPHQRCWVHLLRDSHTLREQHPQNTGLRIWAEQVHGVYERAHRSHAATAEQRLTAQRRFEAELLALCQPFVGADKAVVPQAVLCGRIQKYLPELFTFVGDPAVPSDNNAAERSVRPVVVQRKISGGTRSAGGTSTFTTLQTLFGTWRARHLDPLLACQQMLTTLTASA